MKLIAQKACSFGGKRFYIGDEIPEEYVLNPNAQEKLGTLAIVSDNSSASAPADLTGTETMNVVIHAEEGDMPLFITNDGLQAVVDVLTGNADDAKSVIEQMTDGDALILLHITDNRKSVKATAEARAKALSGSQEGEESEGEQ